MPHLVVGGHIFTVTVVLNTTSRRTSIAHSGSADCFRVHGYFYFLKVETVTGMVRIRSIQHVGFVLHGHESKPVQCVSEMMMTVLQHSRYPYCECSVMHFHSYYRDDNRVKSS